MIRLTAAGDSDGGRCGHVPRPDAPRLERSSPLLQPEQELDALLVARAPAGARHRDAQRPLCDALRYHLIAHLFPNYQMHFLLIHHSQVTVSKYFVKEQVCP